MAEAFMAVRVNGRDLNVALGMSLAKLVEDLGYDSRFLVVELNGQPLTPGQRSGVVLSDGDRLEVVRPVAGG